MHTNQHIVIISNLGEKTLITELLNLFLIRALYAKLRDNMEVTRI